MNMLVLGWAYTMIEPEASAHFPLTQIMLTRLLVLLVVVLALSTGYFHYQLTLSRQVTNDTISVVATSRFIAL